MTSVGSPRVATPLQCDNAYLAIINATDAAGKLGINVATKFDLLAITSNGDKRPKDKFTEVTKAVADIFTQLCSKFEIGYFEPSKVAGAPGVHVKGLRDYKRLLGTELEQANMQAKDSLGVLKQREYPIFQFEDREQIRANSVKTKVDADAVKAKSDLAAKALETEASLRIKTAEEKIAHAKKAMDLAVQRAKVNVEVAVNTPDEKAVATSALALVTKDAEAAKVKAHQEITKLKEVIESDKAKAATKAKVEYEAVLKGGYKSVSEIHLAKIEASLPRLFDKAKEAEGAQEGLNQLAAKINVAVRFYLAIHRVPADVQIVRDLESTELNKELDAFYRANEQRYNTLIELFEKVNNLSTTSATRPSEVRVNISKLQEVVKNEGKSIATFAALTNWFHPAKEAVKVGASASSVPAAAAV